MKTHKEMIAGWKRDPEFMREYEALRGGSALSDALAARHPDLAKSIAVRRRLFAALTALLPLLPLAAIVVADWPYAARLFSVSGFHWLLLVLGGAVMAGAGAMLRYSDRALPRGLGSAFVCLGVLSALAFTTLGHLSTRAHALRERGPLSAAPGPSSPP